MFLTSSALGGAIVNNIDELKELKKINLSPDDIMGFNHIPNTNSTIMENTVLHKADTRGDANHGWLHQNAWFHLGKFDKGIMTEYIFKAKGNGLYIFNLNGDIKINDQLLNSRDGYGIWETEKVTIRAETNAEFLLMEVPMTV